MNLAEWLGNRRVFLIQRWPIWSVMKSFFFATFPRYHSGISQAAHPKLRNAFFTLTIFPNAVPSQPNFGSTS